MAPGPAALAHDTSIHTTVVKFQILCYIGSQEETRRGWHHPGCDTRRSRLPMYVQFYTLTDPSSTHLPNRGPPSGGRVSCSFGSVQEIPMSGHLADYMFDPDFTADVKEVADNLRARRKFVNELVLELQHAWCD